MRVCLMIFCLILGSVCLTGRANSPDPVASFSPDNIACLILDGTTSCLESCLNWVE